MIDASKDHGDILWRPGEGAKGMNRLLYAAYAGDQEAVKACLAAGADPDYVDHGGYSAAHWTADMSATSPPGPRQNIIRLLALRHADFNRLAANGQTPLSLAQDCGIPEEDMLIETLIRYGATLGFRSEPFVR